LLDLYPLYALKTALVFFVQGLTRLDQHAAAVPAFEEALHLARALGHRQK
jgi:hypothetical protein